MNEDPLDRFSRGELSPEESRRLAQRSLDNPDLFDQLTADAIARRGTAARAKQPVVWPRIALLAAAAVIIVAVALRAPQRNSPPAKPDAAISAPPVLIARNGGSDASTFRGAEDASRGPRTTGSIGSLAGGSVSIDLGSLDGLAKDSEVDVLRNGQTVARLKLNTIFRDHSRGRLASGGPLRVNDEVRVPAASQSLAVLDRIAAAQARGDAQTAMRIAQQASADTSDADLSGEGDLNNAGVIAELHGNRVKAAELYRRALQANPPPADRQAIEGNLARLKDAK